MVIYIPRISINERVVVCITDSSGGQNAIEERDETRNWEEMEGEKEE
jgi:hypothetical protein